MQQLFLCKKIRIFDRFATARYFPCWSLHCSGSFAFRRSEKVGKIVKLIQTSYVVQSSGITTFANHNVENRDDSPCSSDFREVCIARQKVY